MKIIDSGNQNKIAIHEDLNEAPLTIHIKGDKNSISIDSGVSFQNASITLGSNNNLTIKKNSNLSKIEIYLAMEAKPLLAKEQAVLTIPGSTHMNHLK
jgi:hypothetical protein